jgi:hypothetical protein
MSLRDPIQQRESIRVGGLEGVCGETDTSTMTFLRAVMMAPDRLVFVVLGRRVVASSPVRE